MKYNYPPLGGICGKAIQNNFCFGCEKLSNPNFRGQEQCNLIQEPRQKIKNILGIGEQMKI